MNNSNTAVLQILGWIFIPYVMLGLLIFDLIGMFILHLAEKHCEGSKK